MFAKADLRKLLRSRLQQTVDELNLALRGSNLSRIEPVISRISRGSLPRWYKRLSTSQTLPNLDGKTIGSVVEMLFVAVLETITFCDMEVPPLSINPARGVDLPDINLNIKSPSTNYFTSEPFFSAYERLLGSEYDAFIMLTDYQERKTTPPLRLQIIKHKYLLKTQLSDFGLTSIARQQRGWILGQNQVWAQKLFRFLAYANQSDWRASQLLRIVDVMQNNNTAKQLIYDAEQNFVHKNKLRAKNDKEVLPNHELESLQSINKTNPLILGVIDALDNWVLENYGDAARLPNENEWQRLLTSPLNGKIGLSFALQWRYNFGRVFRELR